MTEMARHKDQHQDSKDKRHIDKDSNGRTDSIHKDSKDRRH